MQYRMDIGWKNTCSLWSILVFFLLALAAIPGVAWAQEGKGETGTKLEGSSPAAVDPKESAAAPAAKLIETARIEEGRAVFTGDGVLSQFKSFTLRSPSRLVVDLPGTHPSFREKRYSLKNGFRQLRVGVYPDRTRLVFDATGDSLPGHRVEAVGKELIVTWGEQGQTSAPVAARPKSGPVTVKAIDFGLDNGRSVLTITLDGPAEVIEPAAEGTFVRFGIRNAEISRPLRRTLDAFAFPSAVRRVTPYLMAEKDRPEVRFAVELKGSVPFSLQKEGDRLRFVVENQQFAEPVPPSPEKVKIPVPSPAPATPTVAEAPILAPAPESSAVITETAPQGGPKIESIKPAAGRAYRGEKISLVFDDANIRNILQLIGEVSHLNIIAGEDVKGTITLRLIDVPWDQALDLILETKGLGMLREGNVVRILPQEQIRTRRQAELTAVKEERQLEPLVTEVISISYTDLANIAGPSKELLTARGKITQDARNKQIIVTDVLSVIADIRQLSSILDTPERQVMIEARIVEANSSFTRDLGVKWGISHENDAGGPNSLSRINVGLGGSFLIPPPTAGNVLGGAGLGSGITFGRVGIDSTVLDLRISALETSGHGKVISTPRVSTLNGGEATISQGTKIPYQSSGDEGPKTEFVDANLELKVKPVINPDNSIILDIQASNSSIGSTVSTGIGSAPAIDTKEAKTKVLVRDGETTVIGGIFVESENSSHVGVPLLMRIPILGHLFQSTNKSVTRAELLVFITPRIVK